MPLFIGQFGGFFGRDMNGQNIKNVGILRQTKLRDVGRGGGEKKGGGKISIKMTQDMGLTNRRGKKKKVAGRNRGRFESPIN